MLRRHLAIAFSLLVPQDKRSDQMDVDHFGTVVCIIDSRRSPNVSRRGESHQSVVACATTTSKGDGDEVLELRRNGGSGEPGRIEWRGRERAGPLVSNDAASWRPLPVSCAVRHERPYQLPQRPVPLSQQCAPVELSAGVVQQAVHRLSDATPHGARPHPAERSGLWIPPQLPPLEGSSASMTTSHRRPVSLPLRHESPRDQSPLDSPFYGGPEETVSCRWPHSNSTDPSPSGHAKAEY